MTSAYPIDIATLAERVKARAVELGELPAQRRVMAEFKVGRPKATAALHAVTASGFTPTTAPAPAPATPEAGGPDTDDAVPRHLHSVETTDPDHSDDRDPNPVHYDVEPSTSAQLNEAVDAPDTSTNHAPAPDSTVPTAPSAQPDRRPGRVRSWPLLLLALGAFVSIWGGWVGLGELTGFGPIRLLPGIADGWVINSAITLPIGVEAYAAYALRAWLAPHPAITPTARRFAMWSAIGSLVLGAAGQVAYHLMTATGVTAAPWPITAFVACLPVVVLGCGAALTHLLHAHRPEFEESH